LPPRTRQAQGILASEPDVGRLLSNVLQETLLRFQPNALEARTEGEIHFLIFYSRTAWPEARADSRRLKLICAGRLPNPWKRLITKIAIYCDMSQTLECQMNHDSADPKQKRERFQQLTQNPKVKIGKVFAADVRKSRIHPTVKKLTTWCNANRLSQPKAVAVLGQYYFHITFASLRSWEEGRRSPALGVPMQTIFSLLAARWFRRRAEIAEGGPEPKKDSR
jgi:hypothetical protein